MKIDQALARQLLEARLGAELRQEELAAKLGIGRTHVSRLENGKRSTTVQIVRRWFEACGMVLETVSPGDPDRAEALAEALAGLAEDELDDAVRVLRAWGHIPVQHRRGIMGLVAAYEPKAP